MATSFLLEPSYFLKIGLTLKTAYAFVKKSIDFSDCVPGGSNEADHIFRASGYWKEHTGRSIGKALGIPVFAKDWLEGTLLRSGLKPIIEEKPLGFAAYELLTILAERQLVLGQSAILDSVAGTETIRSIWRQLSRQYGADWRVIECLCSDEGLHRSQLKVRKRNIPGWHELAWSDVEKAKQYYRPWDDECLKLDMTNLYSQNFSKAKAYCGI